MGPWGISSSRLLTTTATPSPRRTSTVPGPSTATSVSTSSTGVSSTLDSTAKVGQKLWLVFLCYFQFCGFFVDFLWEMANCHYITYITFYAYTSVLSVFKQSLHNSKCSCHILYYYLQQSAISPKEIQKTEIIAATWVNVVWTALRKPI